MSTQINIDKNIYNSDGTLTTNRKVDLDGKTIDFNDGNVGINTPVPTVKLEVTGNTKLNGTLSVNDSSATLNVVGNAFGQASLISPTGAIVLTPGLYGVQINGANPDLQVNGKTTTSQFQLTTAPTAGYILTSDVSGNGTWNAPTSTSGIFGIANASGVYTYYATLTLAMAAATAGQTIEMFAGVTETGAVTVTLKDGVTINGNGHTYTLNNSGLTHALTVANTVATSCSILNLNVIRTGSTGNIADNSCLILGINGTGVINCSGSTFRNSGSGCGVVFNTNSAHSVNYAIAYATTIYGAIGVFSGSGKLNSSIGYGTSGGIGIRTQNGGDIQNCIGISDSGYGIYGLSGSQSNSVGISTSGNGFFSATVATNCIGRSTSGIGFELSNAVSIISCVGISTSGIGLQSLNAYTYNCTGISSSSSGIALFGTGKMYTATTKSSTSYAMWGAISTCQLYGGTIVCDWNNAAGYGIRGNGGTITNTISNCTFNLSNASAPYLFNDGVAQAISMRGNTYRGGAAFNVNLTQAIVAVEDAQGNIYL